jgi:hypothetical protein
MRGDSGYPNGQISASATRRGGVDWPWALGGNLEDRNSCVFTKGSDRRNANARLRRLSRNGGPTTTHALKRSSDAVNAAKKRGCPRRDQRGIERPQGRRCDSGAYELRVR